MNSGKKIINVLTMCRRAGRLVSGFDAVKEAVFEKRAALVITAEDISPKTLKEVRYFCADRKVGIVPIPVDSYGLYDACGKVTVVAAVCDEGFAGKIKSLADESPINNRQS